MPLRLQRKGRSLVLPSSSAGRLAQILCRRTLKLCQDVVSMSGPVPITAQVAAPPEQKRRSVSAGEFLRVRGEIPEGNPRMPVRIGNSHDAIGALYGDVAALV